MRSYPSVENQQNVQRYFEKYIKEIKNPIFKYDFSFFTLLNGILVRYPEIYVGPADNIKMKWRVQKLGRIQKQQYLQFLREAYKEDYVYGSNRYSGIWADVPEMKEWN